MHSQIKFMINYQFSKLIREHWFIGRLIQRTVQLLDLSFMLIMELLMITGH